MPRCIETTTRSIDLDTLKEVQKLDILIGYLLLSEQDNSFYEKIKLFNPTGLEIFDCKRRLYYKDLHELENQLMDCYFNYLLWCVNQVSSL
jgi:hypothetical protein